jgi:hypothetical protein
MRNSEVLGEEQPGGETNTREQQQQQVNQKIRVIRVYTYGKIVEASKLSLCSED